MSKKDSIIDSAKVSQKQKLTLFLIVAGVVVFLLVVLIMTDEGPKNRTVQQAVEELNITTAAQQIDPRENWIAEGEKKLVYQEKKMRELDKQVELLQKQLEQLNAALKEKQKSGGSSGTPDEKFKQLPLKPRSSTTETARVSGIEKPASTQNPVVGGRSFDPNVYPVSRTRPTRGGKPADNAAQQMVQIEFVDIAVPKDQLESQQTVYKTVKNYMPPGGFAKGVLLSGLDAPTGSQASQNPHPVLIRLTDDAILPSRWRKKTKQCHIIGSGYGDLAAERAYVRTETVACVSKDGHVFDAKIKGYVTDETGSVGIRGKLVSKQGSLMAKAFLAGLGSGFGDTVSLTGATTSISPLGSTTTVDLGQAAQVGAYRGIGNAFKSIAEFYQNLAEQTFPVIEVKAGRTITVVLTSGLRFSDKQLLTAGTSSSRNRTTTTASTSQ